MSELTATILSAISIGAIIGLMATIQDKHLRSTVYSLPIPITIALVATGGNVNSTHIIGLMLINLFLWFVYLLFSRNVASIYIVDIMSALLYVGLGYAVITLITVPFWLATITYILCWIIAMISLSKITVIDTHQKTAQKVSPIKKASVTTVLSFFLFSAKSALQGVVVTFPFSGVFAVVEGKSHLGTLAQTFTRNSVAILALFVTVYMLDGASLLLQLSLGWTVYLCMLMLVRSVPTLKVRT